MVDLSAACGMPVRLLLEHPRMSMIQLLAVIACLIPAAGALYWAVVTIRIALHRGHRPSIRAGLELPEPPSGWPALSIIIPAHDESRVIDRCLGSLAAQRYPDLEIVVVLDRCTDDTPERVRRHAAADDRIRAVELDQCPPEWAGKCHAAHTGYRAARGDRLLFMDADTEADPSLARAAVAFAAHHELALLSLLSTLTVEQPFEQGPQPVATLTLMKMFPMEQVNRRDGRRTFANGQFLLFDRVWYERLGTHEAVRDELLEDLAFARRLRRMGGRGWIATADRMLFCSMYGSVEAFRRGWKRIFIEACHRRVFKLRKWGVRTLLIGVVVPAGQVLATVLGLGLVFSRPTTAAVLLALVGLGLALQYASLRYIYRRGGTPLRRLWRFPLGCVTVAGILLDAADDLRHRRPIRWGGREYVLDPR